MTTTRRIVMFPLTRLLIYVPLTLLAWLLLAGRPGLGSLITSDAYRAATLPLAMVLAHIVLVRLVERRPWSDTGFSPGRLLPDFGLGLIIGGGAIALTVALMAALGYYRVGTLTFGGPGFWAGIGAGLLAYTGVALWEEVLMRGTLQRLLGEWLGPWTGLLLTSLVFGGMHIAGDIRERLFIAVMGGLVYGACYMLARNLWMPIGAHLAWNFMQGQVFGLAVSGGGDRVSLIQPVLQGPAIWTGGSFGGEGSVIGLVVCLVLAGGLLYVARRLPQP